MNNDQNTPRHQQQRGASWIRWLLPLVILLVVAYSPSLMSFFVSIAIIVLIWGLIAAASARARQWTPPSVQQLPLQQPPELETPYEQGYQGVVMTPQPAQEAEEERLAQLKLIGELYQRGAITQEEFER